MSNSVAEFLSKKGVKKFKNGIKANPGRAIMAAAVLATAFTVSSQQKPVETQMDMLRPQTTYAITEKAIRCARIRPFRSTARLMPDCRNWSIMRQKAMRGAKY